MGRALTILLLVAASLSSGCGFTGDAATHGANVLLMNNMAEPAHLDPALQTSVEDQRITLALFEGLLTYHPRTLEPVPGVAERWEVSADGRRYTFFLRECEWSNGDPIRSGDFVYSWRRVLTPPTESRVRAPTQRYFVASPYADLFFCIRGARRYFEALTDDFDEVGITAPDALTLVVELEEPTPWFPELLCFATYAPVHPPTVERYREGWTRPDVLVGNGPFVLASRSVGDAVRVERNPRYWDRARVGLDAVVYFSTDQVDVALDQFLAGETHWVRTFNPKKVRGWRADPELSAALRAPEYLGTFFYRFNVRVPPLDDARVRRALALATDRASITRYVTGLDETPAEGLVPPCVTAGRAWRRLESRGLAFDVDRARSQLAEAGYPEGRGFPVLTLSYNTNVQNKAIGEAVQQMWRKNLGIEIRLENREKRVHLAEERAGNYQISRGSWIGDFNDPHTFLDFMVSSRANNRTGWKNDEYDRLVAESRRRIDESERLAMLQRAEELLMVEEAPLLAIYYYRSATVLAPGMFEGIPDNARDVHPPKYIRRL